MKNRNNKTNWQTILLAVIAAIFLLGAFGVKTQAQDARVPMPDFCEYEKYYEIIKWTYDGADKITIVYKPKDSRPREHQEFIIRFFDEDGVKISESYDFSGESTPIGEVGRLEISGLDGAQIRKAKSSITYQVLPGQIFVGPKPQPVQTNPR